VTYSQSVLTFGETRLFTQLVAQYLSDEEYRERQHALEANPEADDVVRGSAGVRMLRWHGRTREARRASASSTTSADAGATCGC
jgi:hypothetical protein